MSEDEERTDRDEEEADEIECVIESCGEKGAGCGWD